MKTSLFYPRNRWNINKRKTDRSVVEVKMGNITTKEVNNFLRKVEDFDCRKIVIAENTSEDKRVESITAEQLVEKLKKRTGNLKPLQ